MASLRRSTVMPSDSTTSRFLYTILKQLDHKSIDWNSVASDLDITNGHAARMRFSRFKQHMEGILPAPRKPRTESRTPRKTKEEKAVKREAKKAKEEAKIAGVKSEPFDFAQQPQMNAERNEMQIHPEAFVKAEPGLMEEDVANEEWTVKPEPVVKDEPMDDAMDYERAEDPTDTVFADAEASKDTPSMSTAPEPGSAADYATAECYNWDASLAVKPEPLE